MHSKAAAGAGEALAALRVAYVLDAFTWFSTVRAVEIFVFSLVVVPAFHRQALAVEGRLHQKPLTPPESSLAQHEPVSQQEPHIDVSLCIVLVVLQHLPEMVRVSQGTVSFVAMGGLSVSCHHPLLPELLCL